MMNSVYAIVLPIVVLAMIVIATSMWRHRDAPGAKQYAGIIILAIVWMGGDWLSRVGPNWEWQLFGEKVKYLGVAAIPALLWIATTAYRGQSISHRNVFLLFLIPAFTLVMIWTNPAHTLFWTLLEPSGNSTPKAHYGWYFWLVHTPYSYSMTMASTILLIQELLRSPRFYRAQVFVLVITTCIPLLSNFAYLSGLTGGVSYTSLSFAFFSMVIAWGLYRQHLFKSNPIAYEVVFQTIRDSVFVLDSNNLIADVNLAGAYILNRTPERIIGRPAQEAFQAWPEIFARFENVQEAHEEITIGREDNLRHVELRITPLHKRGALIGRIITARDITDAKTREQALETMAFRDTLTKLANRRSFEIEAARLLAEAGEKNNVCAVFYFDLNKFKAVNDTWGHEAGDQLLRYVASRANSCLRRPDLLARLGGDEFAAVVQDVNREGAIIVAERILQSVKRPFKIQEQSFEIGLSIGIAFYPEHGTTLDEVLQGADDAMYRSKANGGGYTFYEFDDAFAHSNAI